MQTRLDWKLILLYTLLVLQVFIVMVYVASTPHVSDLNAPAALRDAITFVSFESSQVLALLSLLPNQLIAASFS
jgi:hypothetical protein